MRHLRDPLVVMIVAMIVLAGGAIVGAVGHAVNGDGVTASWAAIVAILALCVCVEGLVARRWREIAEWNAAELAGWVSVEDYDAADQNGRHRAG